MKKWFLVISLILAFALVVSACGNSEENADEVSTTGEVKEFTINASNYEFDLQEMKVNKGDTVKVTLINTQGNHGVKFEGYNKEVQGNKTITFVANKAGEFDYICSIVCGTGHGTMVGKLIVT